MARSCLVMAICARSRHRRPAMTVGPESGRRGAGQGLDRVLRPRRRRGTGTCSCAGRMARTCATSRTRPSTTKRRRSSPATAAGCSTGGCRASETIDGNRYGEQGQLVFANSDGDRCARSTARAGSIPGRVGARTASRSRAFRSRGSPFVDIASRQVVAHARTQGLLPATHLVAGRPVAHAAWPTRSAPAGASPGWTRRRARSTRSAGSIAARPTGSRTADR